jgi:hypothetical protein
VGLEGFWKDAVGLPKRFGRTEEIHGDLSEGWRCSPNRLKYHEKFFCFPISINIDISWQKEPSLRGEKSTGAPNRICVSFIDFRAGLEIEY